MTNSKSKNPEKIYSNNNKNKKDFIKKQGKLAIIGLNGMAFL